ncbi:MULTISPECIES: extensin family protein [unclassified Ruegeria]|uniref:extensin-like domain-containing protein n=1 Tax=unclassified Ruegeria TaxID=2625375 RepID=UPI0014899165|nr:MULTISPECIES: extensin family protein [unclassified Ruegeria]NOD62322.1 extensin-like protein [Ruegeria sp. HKCCD6109]
MKLGWRHVLIGVLAAAAMTSQAAPLEQSLVPLMRPASDQTALTAASQPTVRPMPRPIAPQVTAAAIRPSDVPLRPLMRPKWLEQEVLFKKRKLWKSSVCGDIAIQGKPVGRVGSKSSACGVKDAVQITSVSGVVLSRPSTMDCGTAIALNKWVDKTVKPTFKRRGPVIELQVAAHYACRTRNNRKGARISEHGKGRAIDISGFKMADGEVVTVLNGWRKNPSQKQLKKIWRGACGPFGTVLGPNSDRYHRDHFHLDTARYRSGPYCR